MPSECERLSAGHCTVTVVTIIKIRYIRMLTLIIMIKVMKMIPPTSVILVLKTLHKRYIRCESRRY